MNKLKNCPFCAGEAEIINASGHSKIVCTECGAQTFSYQVEYENSSQEKAIEAWNRRAYPEFSVECKDCKYGAMWVQNDIGKIGKCILHDDQIIVENGICGCGERKTE